MRKHTPVLLQEIVAGLSPKPGDVVVDATVGAGGHAKEILSRIAPLGTLYGFDKDEDAVTTAKNNLKEFNGSYEIINKGYEEMKSQLEKKGINKIDKILFDLGYSSQQIDTDKRGFSFRFDAPLDMRFSKDSKINAKSIVNDWKEETLADIIYGFGEERYARRIARKIAEERKKHQINTTTELVKIIEKAVPPIYRHKKIHFATKTFQALRIATNEELETIKNALPIAFSLLNKNGRIAVISFHSLEDRIVKRYFQKIVKEKKGISITKKPTIAGEEEQKKNPRARSAKLRIIKKYI